MSSITMSAGLLQVMMISSILKAFEVGQFSSETGDSMNFQIKLSNKMGPHQIGGIQSMNADQKCLESVFDCNLLLMIAKAIICHWQQCF